MDSVQKRRVQRTTRLQTALRVGDSVMVLGGGNSKKGRELHGKVGKILRFFPKTQRVVVEGVNMVKRHRRARAAGESSGILEREGTIHISKVMFYSDEHKRPLRLRFEKLPDGTKVRGISNPKTRKFERIGA